MARNVESGESVRVNGCARILAPACQFRTGPRMRRRSRPGCFRRCRRGDVNHRIRGGTGGRRIADPRLFPACSPPDLGGQAAGGAKSGARVTVDRTGAAMCVKAAAPKRDRASRRQALTEGDRGAASRRGDNSPVRRSGNGAGPNHGSSRLPALFATRYGGPAGGWPKRTAAGVNPAAPGGGTG